MRKIQFFLSEPHQPILKCWKKLERNTEKKWQLIFFNSREINQGNFHFCFAHLSPLICKGVNSSYQFNHLHKRSTEDPHSFSMFTVVYSCRKYLKAACSLEPTVSYSNISNVKEWNKDSLWIFFCFKFSIQQFSVIRKILFCLCGLIPDAVKLAVKSSLKLPEMRSFLTVRKYSSHVWLHESMAWTTGLVTL